MNDPMDDDIEPRLEDLQLVEIQELLEENGIDVRAEQVADLAHFVAQLGGMEAALDALAQLQNQQEVA